MTRARKADQMVPKTRGPTYCGNGLSVSPVKVGIAWAIKNAATAARTTRMRIPAPFDTPPKTLSPSLLTPGDDPSEPGCCGASNVAVTKHRSTHGVRRPRRPRGPGGARTACSPGRDLLDGPGDLLHELGRHRRRPGCLRGRLLARGRADVPH